jgi:hypothetical protein
MSLTEIITIIVSLLSVLISSGTIVALFKLRNENKKIGAEAKKIEAETKVLISSSDLANFQAQIDAANKLNKSMADRLDIVTKELEIAEGREEVKDNKIMELEICAAVSKSERSKLKTEIKTLNQLLGDVLAIINKHLDYHAQIILAGIPVSISEFTIVNDIFLKDIDNIKKKYNKLMEED